MIHQHLAHQVRGKREEALTVCEIESNAILLRQLHPGFVDQGGGL